tara:strand:- start:2049 stop:3569 length:1521 start_codon:yes stop_codon:yes gene_type:complete
MWCSETKVNLLKYKASFSMTEKGKLLLVGYNRQECFKVFELLLEKEPKNSFYHWAIAYSHCADYNMNGPIYELLKQTQDWPSYKTASYHCEKALEYMNDRNDEWKTIYKATKVRLEKGLKSYADYLDTKLVTSEDCDILCIKAESRMLLEPWKLWNVETMKQTENAEHVEMILNKGLQINPTHEWLCHLKIHYCEMGPPEQFDMDVLEPLTHSKNGHLRHMPSHIYIQIGDYLKSMNLNKQAVELDCLSRAGKLSHLDLYAFYECHNIHFVVFSACMCGNSKEAIKYAKYLTSFVNKRLLEGSDISYQMCEAFLMIEPMVYVRFGNWKEILDEKDFNHPTRELFYTYAKSVAYSATNDTRSAKEYIEKFEILLEKIPETRVLHNETLKNIGNVALNILNAEYEYRMGMSSYTTYLDEALFLESELVYDEPPAWMIPVRQTYGALLLEQKNTDLSSKMFIKDLESWPKNIWSTRGLYETQKLILSEIEYLTDKKITAACACATRHWS